MSVPNWQPPAHYLEQNKTIDSVPNWVPGQKKQKNPAEKPVPEKIGLRPVVRHIAHPSPAKPASPRPDNLTKETLTEAKETLTEAKEITVLTENAQSIETETKDILYFDCPHCGDLVQISKKELNCRIFRHGALRATGEQINPHAAKSDCDSLASTGQIYGCGKPFRIVQKNNVETIESCSYI